MDIEYKSTPEQIKSFMETMVYQDFLAELEYRSQEMMLALVDPELLLTGRHYDKTRGGILNMEQMKDVFSTIRENIIDDMERDSEQADD